MDWFRALVSNGGVITKSYTVTGTKTVSEDKLAATKNQLTAQGFEVSVQS
jgi:hypothetical protein